MMKTFIFLGSSVSFSALRLGAALGTALTKQGQEVALVGCELELPVYVQLPVWDLPAKVAIKNLANSLQKQGITRIISLAYLPACQAAVQAKIPFVYIEPENYQDGMAPKLKKTLLAKATRVIVIGADTQALNTSIYSKNAIRVSNRALWVEHVNVPKPRCFKKENNILASGTFDKSDGFMQLLQAWVHLAPLHPSWHLTLVGKGTGLAALQKYIKQQHLAPSTEVLGPETDLYALLRSADIYVNPTLTTNGLEELLDAMASKLPVITTETEGVNTLVQSGINGLVVPMGNVAQLTGALDRLMVDWGYRVSLAIQASQLREKFSFTDFVSKVLND